jgi:hypothetical protein
LAFVSNVDGLPPNAPSLPIAATHRFRLLDAYVGMTLKNWQISFGRQSQWWGPSENGAMLFTDNAEPLNNMLRIDRVQPFQLPWLFRYLGGIRIQAFRAILVMSFLTRVRKESWAIWSLTPSPALPPWR